VGADLLQCPFTRGAQRGGDAGPPAPSYLLADPQGLPWAKAVRHHFSDVEGRTSAHVMGVPGGDIGDFFLSLQAAERLNKQLFDQDKVLELLRSYVIRSSKLSCMYATDEASVGRIAGALGLGSIDRKAPPQSMFSGLLALVVQPTYTGSRFLRLLLERCAERYGVRGPLHLQPQDELRCGLLRDTITAFFLARWNSEDDHNSEYAAERMRLVVWDTPEAAERAWLNIQTPPECTDLALAPLIPTMRPERNVAAFVHHPQFAQLQRTEMARLLAFELPRVDRLSLQQEAQRLAQAWLTEYMEVVARDVSVYDVVFS
jgi:hypothetical protein